LIIALTVLSQSGVLIESYRQEIFEEVVFKQLESYYEDEGDISIDIWRWDFSPSNNITDFEYFNALINLSINRVNYSDYILNRFWYSRLNNYVWLNYTEGYYGEGMRTWSMPLFVSSATEFYSELEHILSLTGKGRLPKNSSEIILIHPKWEAEEDYYYEEVEFKNVKLGAKVNITLSPEWRGTGANKTVKIVGVIDYTPGYQDHPDNSTSLLNKYLRSFWDYAFITKPSFPEQILEEISDPSTEVNVDIRGKIYLDRTRFDAYNINGEISKLENFIRALEWEFKSYMGETWIYSSVLNYMKNYESTIFGLLIIMLLLSFPVLCIALYLVVYSFGLIRKQKQEQIGIIKTRGGSWLQTFVILLGEMIISTFLAVFIGFLLSTFLADVVLRSTNYLEFLGLPVQVHISIGMVQALIFWGLFFALFLNFRNITRMSRQEISETLEPTETRSPVWKRYYLDIIIFVIGTATWVILMTLIRSGGEMVRPEFWIIYFLVSLLGIPAPFLMFFGTIMVIARFFPFIMRKLAEILWRLEGGVNAFSIRNIVRHKQAANRAVLLITLALSFSILSSSLIFSVDETEHLKRYYEVGADISVYTGISLNKSVLEILEQNVSHLESISGVYSTRHYSPGFYQRSYEFLFVDPSTYAKTAFVNPRFKLSSSFTSLMEQLNDNNTVILYKGNLEADLSKPKIGDNFTLQFSNDTHSEQLSFRVAGTFEYWPTMYPYGWHNPAYNYWGIGSLGMFEQLNRSNYFSTINAAYHTKIDSTTNIEETVERIYNVTGITPSSPALSYKEYKTSFNRRFSLSILNSDLIVCLAVAVIGVIMFAFFTYVERGKEIGVERALGMTQFQTAQSFLVEAATILSFGCIIGYITGAYFATMFLQMMQLGQYIPPLVVTYPTALLVQILLGIIIAAGIGTIIPAYIATRKDISRILKVE
ncbi:MAG: ABC transporter permease, partial [Candidatus Heimdallarchaeota archaeon]